MKHFPKAHLWLLCPFFIATTGFFFTYWSKFSEVPFYQHLHGLTATAWYLLLVLQPYLYTRNNMSLHRRFGFIGIFLAGGVVFSALQIVPNNIGSENLSPVLQYGLTFIDFIALTGFSYSLILGVFNRKEISIHARYMISTAFWALLPALARLIYFPMVIIYQYPPPVSFIQVIHISVALVLVTLGIMMWLDYKNEKRFYRAYLLVAAATLFMSLSIEYMGTAQWWIDFCNALLANKIN